MPFHKYIIKTDGNREQCGEGEYHNKYDGSTAANQLVVNTLRHLSQLVKIADDIFGTIEIECRSVHERTAKLSIQLQNCQVIVDSLNAKAVKVPRGSLSASQIIIRFEACDAKKIAIFSSLPRPFAVDQLRDSANGPSPPVVIPSGMVTSEVDACNPSTHIYCRPVKIKDVSKPRNNIASGDCDAHKKPMSSNAKVPSSVVPIDVSGQPFSRMASFRRSLIHVDFLIRRKRKKDKRRNTVAEGDVQELKDALQHIVNDDRQFTLPNGICSYQQIIAESKNVYNTQNQINDRISVERNNNSANVKPENEKSKNHLSNSETGKRKLKSHIPISTLSAAMNVAVEMRQCDGIRTNTTVSNGIFNNNSDPNSSDSERKVSHNMNSVSSSYNDGGSQDESWTTYKNRLQEKCTNNRKDKEIEVSSSASSENIAATLTESDSFFISSDESEEDASDFQETYGSSTSLGTASDGSLNSLLSETGTEMTSSTGTLTSIGREHLLTPPPPPPMILSATLNNKDIVAKVSDSESLGFHTKIATGKAATISQKQAKQIKSPKSSKPFKSDFLDLHKNLTENSKNIFTSLVSLKTHTKDKNKSKHKEVEKKKLSHPPAFDMYGNNSPTKVKQIPNFIKENVSPVIQNEGKSDMKSFFANDRPFQLSDSVPDRNISWANNTEATKTKGSQSLPPKYEHQVTVKPVQRFEQVKSSTERENQPNRKPCNMLRQCKTYAPPVHRPNPPVTLQQDRSKAARVVLDLNGRVIYSTNSLDRKHPHNLQNDTHFQDMKFNNHNRYYHSYQENSPQFSPEASYNLNGTYAQENQVTLHSQTQNRSEKDSQVMNESYHLNQTYEYHFPTPNWRNSHSCRSDNMETYVLKRADTRPYSYAGNSSDAYLSTQSNDFLPDPNISGLPVQETMLTRYNVDRHSKHMEKMSLNSPENSYSLSDAYCLSPSSHTNSGYILNKSPQSNMSTEDLFAVIHNCKKRMNIKTDSDISMASSSRSSSPSCLRPSSSKSTLAETGFLSPRSQVHFETSRDRSSWADFRPVESVCNERKSLASDRLGPTKPTSMHDFKMLLLQARFNSQVSGPRKSAVEMLKVPVNRNNTKAIQSLSLNLSQSNSFSMSVQNSPTIEMNFHNGHSTVPFKRGSRVRASLQPRYIMYPPIFEDCSEDSENCSDLIPATATCIENKNGKENLDWKQ